MIDVEAVRRLFAEPQIPVQESELLPELAQEQFPEEVNAYLRLMNAPVKLHVSPHGTPLTYLLSQKEIAGEFREPEQLPVIENHCLILGFVANGDWLCVNLLSGNIVYIFHDILWEEPEEAFDEMHIELKIKLEELLQMAFSGEDYPFDGFSAEQYRRAKL